MAYKIFTFLRKPFSSVSGKIILLTCCTALFSAVIVSGMYYQQVAQVTVEKQTIKLEDRALLLSPLLQGVFHDMSRDLAFQATAPAVGGLAENYYPEYDKNSWNNVVVDLFEALLISKPGYRQIAVIGIEDGVREIARVYRSGDQIRVAGPDELRQNKDEDFFKETIRLGPGQVYLSDIILEEENNHPESQLVPIIRAATPLYKNGKLFGILSISSTYDFVVDRLLAELIDRQDLFITDSEGNYLVQPDKSKTFGFLYGAPHTMVQDVPEIQGFLNDSKRRTTLFYDEGGSRFVLHVIKVFFDPQKKERFLVLGLRTSYDALLADVQIIARNGLYLTLVSLLLALTVAVLLARFLTEPLRQMTDGIAAYEKGRLNPDLPVNRNDEIGEMAVAFQALTENLDQSRRIEQETLARLQAILDNTVDGLITIDERGTVQHYNRACERIFGYLPAEVIGKNVKMLMPPRFSDHHDEYLANYHRTGEAKIIGIGREVEARHKDGTVFPIDLSVAQVNIKGRRIYSGIVRDITERKKAEEELVRSNLELERFAYVASHDLQEPLRMVANFTSLLQEEYATSFDDQGRQYMGFIIDAARRMQAMVNDLLEYSRIGHEDSGFVDVDCNALAVTAMENLKESIKETNARVTVDALPMAYVNAARFTGLLQNLIGNAIKYRDKSRAPEIRISAVNRGEDWMFIVADNGIGIKQEYLKQIFIIFKRLHGKGEYQGTGIGLAICKKVVESFGGKIWAESEPGKGTTFYFTIPRHQKARAA